MLDVMRSAEFWRELEEKYYSIDPTYAQECRLIAEGIEEVDRRLLDEAKDIALHGLGRKS